MSSRHSATREHDQRPTILMFGGGGHARVVAEIAYLRGLDVAAWVIPEGSTGGLPEHAKVIRSEGEALAMDVPHGVVAIGDNWVRKTVFERIREIRRAPFWFPSLWHPSAIISNTGALGAGTVVMAGAVINPGVRIGDGAIVNTRAAIDHDGRIGRFASIAPGAVLGGDCVVGDFAAIGIGAIVLHGRKIGDHAVVGAGAVVTRDIPPNVVAYGNPARVIRERKAGERYL